MAMKMSSHNTPQGGQGGPVFHGHLLYIVTDRYRSHSPAHMVMTEPEQFVHWVQNEIVPFNKADDQAMKLARDLIAMLRAQSSGRPTYNSVVRIADQLGLQVTVIAGAQLTD